MLLLLLLLLMMMHEVLLTYFIYFDTWFTGIGTSYRTKWSRVLLDKLTVSQLVKFPAFYENRSFITGFTSPPPVPFLIQINQSMPLILLPEDPS